MVGTSHGTFLCFVANSGRALSWDKPAGQSLSQHSWLRCVSAPGRFYSERKANATGDRRALSQREERTW